MNYLSSKQLQELVDAARSRNMRSIAYLPVGCIEQHGPFLPLETDSLIAQEISHELSERFKDRYFGYGYPVIQFTPSQANANYCGTVSVPDSSFRTYAREVCSAIMQSPFDALVIIAGHAGAEPSLREIAFWLVNGQYSAGVKCVRPVLVLSVFDVAALMEEKFGQKPGRHADWREFLLLYHILGGEYFTAEKIQRMKAFHEANTFDISLSRIHGVPMEYRSTEGVLGEPLPVFSDDYKEISSVVWDFLIANLMQNLAGELDGFWAGSLAC